MSDCRWRVTRVEGRGEFQTRSYRVPCGKPVESGLWCPKHNAMDARDKAKAEAKRADRAARAARRNR